ncbi:MAG: hypothetical protein ACI9EF_002763 [Pseudohongiellaceae bacterium]|jgi:hypothetical protein
MPVIPHERSSETQGFHGSTLSRVNGSNLRFNNGSTVQRFKGSKVQGFKGSRVQRNRGKRAPLARMWRKEPGAWPRNGRRPGVSRRRGIPRLTPRRKPQLAPRLFRQVRQPNTVCLTAVSPSRPRRAPKCVTNVAAPRLAKRADVSQSRPWVRPYKNAPAKRSPAPLVSTAFTG